MPYGHASILLLGEGSEATEPYNKDDKIRPHSIRSLQFDQQVRLLSFRPETFDLFTATQRLQWHCGKPLTIVLARNIPLFFPRRARLFINGQLISFSQAIGAMIMCSLHYGDPSGSAILTMVSDIWRSRIHRDVTDQARLCDQYLEAGRI